jgi:hypothetical protein
MISHMDDRERMWAAVHEAAHVVIAELVQPQLIAKASVVPDDQATGHVLYDEDVLATTSNFDLAVVMAAGPLAEAFFSDDLHDLKHLAWRLEAIHKAAELIQLAEEDIFRVASALLADNELIGEQLRKVSRHEARRQYPRKPCVDVRQGRSAI